MTELVFPNERTRRRHDLPRAASLETALPLDKEIEQTALRFSTMVGNLRHSEHTLREERDQLLARIEHFQSREIDLLSQLESERARTAAAKQEAEDARAEPSRAEPSRCGWRPRSSAPAICSTISCPLLDDE